MPAEQGIKEPLPEGYVVAVRGDEVVVTAPRGGEETGGKNGEGYAAVMEGEEMVLIGLFALEEPVKPPQPTTPEAPPASWSKVLSRWVGYRHGRRRRW